MYDFYYFIKHNFGWNFPFLCNFFFFRYECSPQCLSRDNFKSLQVQNTWVWRSANCNRNRRQCDVTATSVSFFRCEHSLLQKREGRPNQEVVVGVTVPRSSPFSINVVEAFASPWMCSKWNCSSTSSSCSSSILLNHISSIDFTVGSLGFLSLSPNELLTPGPSCAVT